jgi:hypothetical protein
MLFTKIGAACIATRLGVDQVNVDLMDGRLRFGERFVVSFHRTLRLPDDSSTYPLPPGLGLLPVVQSEINGGVPQFLVPLYRREALWIGFSAAAWKPTTVKVIASGINTVSGLPDEDDALGEPQNYLVCPDQPWLDGCNIGDGVIRQFVAMPLGEGYGLGARTATGEQGGLDIIAFDPLPGRFPDAAPLAPSGPAKLSRMVSNASHEMTLGAGGRMRQKIYPDRFGRDSWDVGAIGRAHVRLVDARAWPALTGEEAPPSPIDAESYTHAGLPWFDIYDEGEATVIPAAPVPPRTIGEHDRNRGTGPAERPIDVNIKQITIIGDHKAGRRD